MKAVVFDLGNVLVAYDWNGYLKSFGYSEETYRAVADAVFLSPEWELGDAGTPPDEWLRMFIANAPSYEKEIREVYEHLEKCIWTYSYTQDLINAYQAKGYKVYYLSNYSEWIFEKTKDTLSFLDVFDGGIFSYRAKCIKPGSEIYRKLIQKYDLIPEETLFFDDREDNVEAAANLGFAAVVFTEETALKALHSM